MFMPKIPVSVTLDADNLIWLRGRVASRKRRSLSEALDEIVTAARTSAPAGGSRSVVGTIDIGKDDPNLDRADAYVRGEFETSLTRPLTVHDVSGAYGAPAKPKRPAARPSRKQSGA